jgi:CHRD domain
MKEGAFRITAAVVGLGLAVTAAGTAVARSQADRIQLTTTLSASEEVPAPTGEVSAARGTFTATASRSSTGAVLNWNLTFSGLTGPAVAAHIHIAARGVAGPVSVPLCGPCESGASGSAPVDASVLAALESGGAYANIHTPTNRAGEVRGQLAVTATAQTALNARQEVPRPKGNVRRARGAFTATATKSDRGAVLSWRLTFNALTGRAVAAHIHIGARGRSGPVVVPLFSPCLSGARGRVTLPARAITALEAGRSYVNVHTSRNAAGEIRGQIPAVALSIG